MDVTLTQPKSHLTGMPQQEDIIFLHIGYHNITIIVVSLSTLCWVPQYYSYTLSLYWVPKHPQIRYYSTHLALEDWNGALSAGDAARRARRDLGKEGKHYNSNRSNTNNSSNTKK